MLFSAYFSCRLGSLMRRGVACGQKKRTRLATGPLSLPVPRPAKLSVRAVGAGSSARAPTRGDGKVPLLVNLAEQEDGDDERVDDERLDEGEAEDHRREELARGA